MRDAKKRGVRELLPSLPVELEAILDRTMQKQRVDRYQSGKELARELFGFLEKHCPDYRRPQFSRFMRHLFKDEIEKELRLLESWTLDAVDESKVGVNLIADALGDDAPFRQFSPASSVDLPRVQTRARLKQDSVEDLPAVSTGIYRREMHGELPVMKNIHSQTPLPDLHARSTMLLEGREAEVLIARLRASDRPRVPGLHEQQTRIIAVTAVPETASAETDLPGVQTVLATAPKFAAKPPPVPRAARVSHDTKPDTVVVDGTPGVVDDSTERTAPANLPQRDFAEDDADAPTDPRRRDTDRG